MFHLTITASRSKKNAVGITYEINGKMLVGRAPKCAILLYHEGASRQQFTIEPSGDGLLLIDLDSLNGTYVDDVKLQNDRMMIYPGSVITVADITFLVRSSKIDEYDQTSIL